MKYAATVLLFCLTMNATVLSQATSKDTVAVLSVEQLHTTALIFAEHEFLQKKNALLEEQVNTLQQSAEAAGKMITEYQNALRELDRNNAEVNRAYEAIVKGCREEVTKQKKKMRRRTTAGIIGGIVVGVIAGGIIF